MRTFWYRLIRVVLETCIKRECRVVSCHIADDVHVAASSSHSYLRSRRPAASQSIGSAISEEGTPAASSCSTASVAESASHPMFSRRRESDQSSAFVDWLMQHVELALTHGFDDNVGRNPVPATFELATLADWFAVVSQLHHVFWADIPSDSRLHAHFLPLKSLSDTDVRFSERFSQKLFSVIA